MSGKIGVIQAGDEVYGRVLLELLEYYTATISTRHEGPVRRYRRKIIEDRWGYPGTKAFEGMIFVATSAILIGDEAVRTMEFTHFGDPEITVCLDKPVLLQDEYDADYLLVPARIGGRPFSMTTIAHRNGKTAQAAFCELDELVALRNRRKLAALTQPALHAGSTPRASL